MSEATRRLSAGMSRKGKPPKVAQGHLAGMRRVKTRSHDFWIRTSFTCAGQKTAVKVFDHGTPREASQLASLTEAIATRALVQPRKLLLR